MSKPDHIAHVDGVAGIGRPELTFDYSGIGTSRFVYAQLVDNETGLVIGNIVTPIPVTLDGRTHQADISLEAITHQTDHGILDLFPPLSPYESLTNLGIIDVSSIELSLPDHGRADFFMPFLG